ncbi:50S ribosomal protein L10 [Aureibacter tunicatorum]|uniref:Large ribosomal subunit protein uL10 n=1 Tax=Aureibacter tunicatorum TaxID=866807 RepID=A0AAE3XK86_9BACT|nr:50S ribosomal protein L10 [Aureibacter tunicatorum]MDR6237952.1 large subunit ribosomal protein L10 [Aureibacter tunicatorum]BDD02985.1 50S ribosomal protein L10 [Aureibacter tunicatorum]
MDKVEKNQVIEELLSKFEENDFFYIVDASTLTVAEINDFRRLCFEKGVEYKVYKNTLIRKALERLEADFAPFVDGDVFKGQSGIIFSKEVSNLPAKILKEFRKSAEKPTLKGASIDYDLFVGDNQIDPLSKLKSKVELIGEVIGLLQSPAKNVISGLKRSGGDIAGILKTLSER